MANTKKEQLSNLLIFTNICVLQYVQDSAIIIFPMLYGVIFLFAFLSLCMFHHMILYT